SHAFRIYSRAESLVSPRHLRSFPTRRSSDLAVEVPVVPQVLLGRELLVQAGGLKDDANIPPHRLPRLANVEARNHDLSLGGWDRSEEHTSELQSHLNLVCRLLLAKKKNAPVN